MTMMLIQKGKNPEVLEELYSKTKLEGAQKYEEFINDK